MPNEQRCEGWTCNRCNQYHEGERIPNRCVNCGGQEFRMVEKQESSDGG